jgi:transcriptional regulator with XRE-family HTH domain
MESKEGDKLRRFLKSKDISAEELAKKIGVAKGTIYNWIKKDKLDLANIAILRDHGFDLEKSSTEFDLNTAIENKIYEVKKSDGNIIYVPLIAYGGFLHGYANKVYLDSMERFSLPGIQGEHYAFEVDGMSMYDIAVPGDTAIGRLEENFKWMVKGKAYVLQTVNGILIKIFEGIKNDKAYFKSYNPDYDGLDLPLKELKRVYFVTRILKKI